MARSAERDRTLSFVPPRERIFRRALARSLEGCDSVLDVGCGSSSPLARCDHAGSVVGVDVSRGDLESARAAAFHASLVRADVRDIGKLFPPRSFDAVVALDVIEHLPLDGARALLDDLERLARRRVVVFTPNGFVPQPATPENPHQEHRSGFRADDLRARGYQVRGIHGLWFVFGAFGEVRLAPGFFWRRFADATAPIVYALPRFAFSLLATKEVG